MIWPLRAPTHFRTAMLRIFCSTNTRVTLDTRDAAEDDDDQADQAQVVLGALEISRRSRPRSPGTSAR